MKVVLALAVLAFLAIGVNGVAQMLGPVATTNSLTLTSSDDAAFSNFVITVLTPASGATVNYQGDADGSSLHTVFNVTWTGYLPASIVPDAEISFSGPTYNFIAGCTGVGGNSVSLEGRYGDYLTFDDHFYPYYTAAGAQTATITLYYPPTVVVATATFSFTVVAPVWAPTGDRPTVSSFFMAASQTVTTDVGLNVTITGTTAGTYGVKVVFEAATAPQGVVYSTQCSISATASGGTCGSDQWTNLVPSFGSFCGDYYAQQASAGLVSYPENTLLVVRSIIITQGSTGAANSFSGSAAGASNQLTITTGEDDATPPACTGATFATPLAVDTASTPITKVITLVCTDTGGVGVEYAGAFCRGSAPGITYDFPAFSGSTTLTPEILVPLHYDGTVDIIGVWAVDGAGNAVLYGSCGNQLTTQGYSSLCGGSFGSSPASYLAASIAVVIACILAVLAL